MKFSKEALWEMGKEGLRIAFFAALSAVVAFALQQVSNLDQTETVVVIATFVLRLVDKYIHENQTTELNGLAPF